MKLWGFFEFIVGRAVWVGRGFILVCVLVFWVSCFYLEYLWGLVVDIRRLLGSRIWMIRWYLVKVVRVFFVVGFRK